MFEVIDDFLSQEDFNIIKNTLFPQDLNNPTNFTWNYQTGIARDPKLGPTGYEENDWYYNRQLYSSDNGIIKYDKYYSIVKPIIDKLKIKRLFVVRANLIIPTSKHIQHEFHIDRDVSHKVALFYVTECNGFTILKDTTEVKCVENRMLIFDGSIEHCSVTSTDHPRSVININYENI